VRLFVGDRGWLDYLLAAVCCVTALVSVSLSVSMPSMAWLLTGIVLAGLACSMSVASLPQRWRWQGWDGTLWTLFAFAAALNVGKLNALLPGGGFPFQIIAAAWLCWMVVLCSFFCWRDQTLLFLTLPCIALYGLVGTFENYAYGTAMFFAFLVSAATLYSRVHHRSMIEQAVSAGVREPGLLMRDRWKWMAGPEWAVGSAFVVVLISLVGAPALRFSVQNVAGRITVALPEARPPENPVTNSSLDQTIGNGPQGLDETILYRVKYTADRPYLRSSVLVVPSFRGWNRLERYVGSDDFFSRRVLGADIEPGGTEVPYQPGGIAESIDEPVRTTLTVKDNFAGQSGLASPGPVVAISSRDNSRFQFTANGQAVANGTLSVGERIEITALLPRSANATGVGAGLPGLLAPYSGYFRDPGSVSNRFNDFVRKAVGQERDDYRRALRLKSAIAASVDYNLRAPAVPSGTDPVDYFLFDSRQGYCDLFATTMARGARVLGMPSRYVVGYLVDTSDVDAEGFINIRRRDFHAWCEIHFPGYGWLPFDATEGAVDVSPDQSGGARQNRAAWWRHPALRWGSGVAVVAVLFVAAYRWRHSLAKVVGPPPRQKLAAAHSRFVGAVERATGEPRRFNETLTEYLARVGRQIEGPRDQADQVASELDAALFGPPEGSAGRDEAAYASATAFAQSIKGRKRGRG
jgi:hypothetical protein